MVVRIKHASQALLFTDPLLQPILIVGGGVHAACMFGGKMKLLMLLIVLVVSGCSRSLPDGSYEKLFDEVLWKSPQGLEADASRVTPRQKMLGNLLDKHIIGKSRREIITMLGEPSTKTDPDGTGAALSYPTGVERGGGFRIDSEWLLIYFDSSGKASKYKIAVD